MAQKVTIDIPGIGKIDAQNAASEYTLNEILKILQGFQKAGGGGGGGGKGAAADKKAAEAAEDKAAADKEASITGLKLADSFLRLSKTTTLLMSRLATMGSSVSGAANAASAALGALPGAWGVAGKIVGEALTATAEAVERSVKAYQDAASAGAYFGGSVGQFGAYASAAGMDLQKFGSFIKESSAELFLLSDSVESGAKRFGALSKAMRAQADDLYALGYNTEDLNKGILAYTNLQKLSGNTRKMSDEELVKGAKNYLKEIDMLAQATGEDRKAKEENLKKLQQDSQLQAAAMGMGGDAMNQMTKVVAGVPAGMQTFVKDYLATGTATLEENQIIASQMGETGNFLVQLRNKIKNHQEITAEDQDKLQAIMKAEALKGGKSLGETLAASGKDYSGLIKGLADAQTIQIGSFTKAAQAQQNATQTTDDLNAAHEKFSQKIAEVSNFFTNMLSSMGVFKALTTVFDALVIVGKILSPVFTLLGIVVGFAADILSPFIKVIGDAVDLILSIVQPALEILGSAANFVGDLFKDILGGAINFIEDKLKKYLGPAFDMLRQTAELLAHPFKSLYKLGWDLDKALNLVSSSFKLMMLDLGKAFDDMIDWALGWVGKGKSAAQKKADDEAYAAKRREITTSIDATQAAAKQAAATRESTAEVKTSGTVQQQYRQATEQVNKQAQTTVSGLGRVAAQFESGGKAGTISSGKGDAGGKSYGMFQLASKTGDVDKFLQKSGYAAQFQGMQVGSAGFDAKWKELAQNDPKFAQAQQAHAKTTHYDPQMAKLQKAGIDLSGKGLGVQEAVMSTANQYGANTSTIINALKGKDTGKMSDKEIINAIQDYKQSNVATNFRSSSAAVQAGVSKRIEQERAALLGVQGGPLTAQATAPATPAPKPADAAGRQQIEKQAADKAEADAQAKKDADARAAAQAAAANQQPGWVDSLSNMFGSMNSNLNKISTNTANNVDATAGLNGNAMTYAFGA